MTSRERVLTALDHREPDRVPIEIGGKASNMTTATLFRVKKHFGITDGDVWNRPYETAAYYNEQVIEKLGGDFRHLTLMPPDSSDFEMDENGYLVPGEDGTVVNEWGFQYKYAGGMSNIVNAPLKGADVNDLDNYPWPDPFAPGRDRDLKVRAEFLYNQTDYAIATRAVSHGFFELAHEMRGFQDFLMDLYINPDFANALLDKILGIHMKMHEVLLKDVGQYVLVVQTADDYGMQSGMLMPPDIWRKFIKPRKRDLNEFIKDLAPNAKIFHHSCGSVYPIIGDLIDVGVGILNPIQPLATDMDPVKLKEEFGKDICFHGGIDQQNALPGTIGELDLEIRQRISVLAKDGGYILAPTSNIQDDTSIENILYLYEKAKEYGRYPITV